MSSWLTCVSVLVVFNHLWSKFLMLPSLSLSLLSLSSCPSLFFFLLSNSLSFFQHVSTVVNFDLLSLSFKFYTHRTARAGAAGVTLVLSFSSSFSLWLSFCFLFPLVFPFLFLFFSAPVFLACFYCCQFRFATLFQIFHSPCWPNRSCWRFRCRSLIGRARWEGVAWCLDRSSTTVRIGFLFSFFFILSVLIPCVGCFCFHPFIFFPPVSLFLCLWFVPVISLRLSRHSISHCLPFVWCSSLVFCCILFCFCCGLDSILSELNKRKVIIILPLLWWSLFLSRWLMWRAFAIVWKMCCAVWRKWLCEMHEWKNCDMHCWLRLDCRVIGSRIHESLTCFVKVDLWLEHHSKFADILLTFLPIWFLFHWLNLPRLKLLLPRAVARRSVIFLHQVSIVFIFVRSSVDHSFMILSFISWWHFCPFSSRRSLLFFRLSCSFLLSVVLSGNAFSGRKRKSSQDPLFHFESAMQGPAGKRRRRGSRQFAAHDDDGGASRLFHPKEGSVISARKKWKLKQQHSRRGKAKHRRWIGLIHREKNAHSDSGLIF